MGFRILLLILLLLILLLVGSFIGINDGLREIFRVFLAKVVHVVFEVFVHEVVDGV